MDGDNDKQEPLLCSSRFGLAFLAFLGYIMMYAMRVNISVALVCMVNHTAQVQHHTTSDDVITNVTIIQEQITCSGLGGTANQTTSKVQDGEFDWAKEVQGLILGSFFWGYLVTQLPGGWLAARYGGKHVVGLGILFTSLFTLCVPVASRFDYRLLIVLRFLTGLSEGVIWPATNDMWAYWAPPLERSKLAGFTNAGAQIGNVITLPLSALLCEYGFDGGWPSVFYIMGCVGIVWFAVWTILVANRPEEHRRISESEKIYIQDSLKGQTRSSGNKQLKVPWMCILTSLPVWCLQISQICAAWGIYMFLTSIPTYMKEVLKMNIKENGFYSAIPYIGMWIVINISGWIADLLRSREVLSTTVTRKLFNSLGLLVPGALCVSLGFVDCSQQGLAVALLTLGVSFIGCIYGAGLVINHVDIAPKYASVLFGITNTIATVAGFLAPYTVGVITTNQTLREWRTVFYVTAVIYLVGTIVFLLGASGEVQPWAVLEEEEEEEEDYYHRQRNGKSRTRPMEVEYTTSL